ncbi:MAG TPA: anion transporter [bacterium]|nr:anion transporter [bacterium]
MESALQQNHTGLILAILLITVAGVAIGRLPRLRMNRATIALTGATLLVLLGAMPLRQAYAALDLDTLALLLAMMIIIANLQLAGFFRLAGSRVLHWARSPRQLLGWIMAASGLFSALFLNDTIVLMFTPLVLEITLALRRNPIPYLMGLATAANIGSVATITGNPQNMIIGIAAGVSYAHFASRLLPVAIPGLVIAWLVLVVLYPAEFRERSLTPPPLESILWHKAMLIKGCVAVLFMLVNLLSGLPIPLSALAAAALLLITRRIKPERVFREMDWSLLIFFAGLFIVTGAIESAGLSERLFRWIEPVAGQSVAALSITAALLSNLVSNVPAVLLFRPVIPHFAHPEPAWLTLAMATTLAGNLTLLGSVANLIVAESARRRGVVLSFREYLRAGVPITLLTLLWGIVWLSLTG